VKEQRSWHLTVIVLAPRPAGPRKCERKCCCNGERWLSRRPDYVLALSNDDLILNRLKERGHRFRRSSVGCFELASSLTGFRTADPSEVARCLGLIESLAGALREMDDDDADCGKCLMKLWLFAARIARGPFPAHCHRYLFLAKSVIPPRPTLWSFADVREEIDWYVKRVGAEGRRFA